MTRPTDDPAAPDGQEASELVHLGEATRQARESTGAQSDATPDLDDRQRSLSTTRKPAGPPLAPSSAPAGAARESAAADDVPPTEPTEP